MADLEKNIAALEALLFIHGEPVTYKKIAAVLGIGREEAETLAEELKQRLEDPARGLQLVSDREKVQLATKPEWNTILESFVKEELTEDLTPASLETLSDHRVSRSDLAHAHRISARRELVRDPAEPHDPRPHRAVPPIRSTLRDFYIA